MQKNRKIITILLLLGFGFFFTHSEMNFLAHVDCDLHQHHLHDYCQLVKGAKVERSSNDSAKYLLERAVLYIDDCCNDCDMNKVMFRSKNHRIKKKLLDTPLYITNNILLI